MSSSKILVTGGNGFVGKSLCNELLKQGQSLNIVAGSRNFPPEHIDIISILNIDAFTDWTEVLLDVSVVIHLAARVHILNETASDPLTEFRKVNVDGTLNLARQAAKQGVKRFIYISSIGVNGNSTSVDSPYTPNDKPSPHDFYSQSKYEAELGLRKLADEVNLEVVIIRPPLIYGYEAPGNFKRLITALKKGLPLPLGAIHNKRSFVYIHNLVSLILKCIDHPNAANQIFLVSDGNDLSTTELLRGCAKALGVKSRLLPIPQKLIEVFTAVIGKKDVAQRLCGNLQVDISKARILLDWTPPITVEEGLRATAQSYIKASK